MSICYLIYNILNNTVVPNGIKKFLIRSEIPPRASKIPSYFQRKHKLLHGVFTIFCMISPRNYCITVNHIFFKFFYGFFSCDPGIHERIAEKFIKEFSRNSSRNSRETLQEDTRSSRNAEEIPSL